MRTEGLQTDQYQTATFALTKPVAIPAAALTGTASDVTLTGDLTLHGVKKSVSIPAQAQLVNGTIPVAGALSFPLSDFSITPPNVGGFILSIADTGALEFTVSFAKETDGPLLRVDAPGVELLADQAELLGGRRRRRAQVGGDLDVPADRLADGVERRARMERLEPHLAGVVEAVDAEVGDDDATARGPASRPRAGSARPAPRRRGCPATSGSRSARQSCACTGA